MTDEEGYFGEGAGADTRMRPVASAKAQTSISGGVRPRLVRAVQIWLR